MLSVVCALLTCIASIGSASAQWSIAGSVNSTSTETAVRPVVDSSGNIVVAGKSNTEGYVAKYNSSGVLLWRTTLTANPPAPSPMSIEPKAVAISSLGVIYVVSQTN